MIMRYVIEPLAELYARVFNPRASKAYMSIIQRLVESTDEVVELRHKLNETEEALKAMHEENGLLWDQIDEVRQADRALKNQLSSAMEDAYFRNLKPVGDA